MISLVEFLYYLITDVLVARKEEREPSLSHEIAPAFKLFASAPANEDSLKIYSKAKIEKSALFVKNEQLFQRNQKLFASESNRYRNTCE